ncbi:hypothetical protein V1506DRAFT_545786 [Lipomyces tetrasporus]
MAAQVSSQPSSHSRKSRFSWVRKLVSTSRSSHSKTSSSPPPYASSHALTTHSQIEGMSPVTTTSSSLAPLYNYSATSHQRTYSRDESLRTPSILTTSTNASVNSGPYRGGAYHNHSRRRASSGIVDDRSSVDSNASLSLSATSGANGNYVYGNVFTSGTTTAGTMTPHASKRLLQTKLTPSITTTTTGTTTSRRSPSILSSSSSTNNTSLMTLPPGFNHVTTSTTNSINTSTSNYYYTDNASVITLASSSKRRRKSIDTNASTRALAPDSLFGGSRESLPLTVATGGGASSFGRSVSMPAYGPGSGRRSTSGSRRTTPTEEYDSGTESCSEDEIDVTGEHANLDDYEHENAGARCEKISVELIGRGRSPVAASMMA